MTSGATATTAKGRYWLPWVLLVALLALATAGTAFVGVVAWIGCRNFNWRTGLLATAGKEDLLEPVAREALHASMRALNAVASRAALANDVRCATDLTGFGLLGHASHIARASDVTLRFDGRLLPELPGARALWASGVRTGGAERNESFVATLADWVAARPADVALALDPQTSGGLLVAVPPARLADYLSAVSGSVVVGQVEVRGNALIVLG